MKDLMFIRMRNDDDIVGYVTEITESSITIQQPLFVGIETLYEEGKQIIALREYIPQSIVDLKEVKIPTNEIIFMEPTRSEFADEYHEVAEMFYESAPKIKSTKKRKGADGNNVINMLDALTDKKDKTTH